MADLPLVSVIIPTYNAERYAAKTLRSVSDQTYPRFEAIIVDDGSADGTVGVIEPFLSDHRFTLIRSDHGGPSAARNRALSVARGSLVAFVDSDDVLLPGRLEKQVEAFLSDPSIDICATNMSVIDDNDSLILPVWTREYPHALIADPKTVLYREYAIQICTSMVRRKRLEAVGGFNESLIRSEDYDLWLRMAQSQGGIRVAFLEDVLTRKRWLTTALSYNAIEAYRSTVWVLGEARKRERAAAGRRILRESIRTFKSTVSSTDALDLIPDSPVAAAWKLIAAWYYRPRRLRVLACGVALLVPSILGGFLLRPRIYASMRRSLWDGRPVLPS